MNQRVGVDSLAAGFDQPLALWHTCHVRVQRMVGLIERLREYLLKNPVDETAQTTATSIRRYFNEAAVRHHADEEEDLFPRLRGRLPAGEGAALATALRVLHDEHTSLGVLWTTLDAALAEIEQGRAAELDEATVLLYASGYRRHCEIEDTVVANALEHYLTVEDLRAIGEAMAARHRVGRSDRCAAGDAVC